MGLVCAAVAFLVLWAAVMGAPPPPPPRLSPDFDLRQNASFFQFVPGADGWMAGTGWIHTANLMGHAMRTHWACFGVLPAEGAVLTRFDLNVSYYLFGFVGGQPSQCARIPIQQPQPSPWAFLASPELQYAGVGVAECGVTDTWSTTGAANMSAVAVCRGNGVPVYVSQYTQRYFAGGNVFKWSGVAPPLSLFQVPAVC